MTLRRALREAIKNPRHVEARIEKGALMVHPAISAAQAEAKRLHAKQGITRDVPVHAAADRAA